MCFCSPRGCSLHSTIASRADRCSGPKVGSFLPGQLMQMNGAVVNQGTIMGTIHPPFDSRAPTPRPHQRQPTRQYLDLECKQNQIMPQDQFLSIREKRLSLRLQDLALVSRHPLQNLLDCGLGSSNSMPSLTPQPPRKTGHRTPSSPMQVYKSILRGQARPRGTKGRDVTPNLP